MIRVARLVSLDVSDTKCAVVVDSNPNGRRDQVFAVNEIFPFSVEQTRMLRLHFPWGTQLQCLRRQRGRPFRVPDSPAAERQYRRRHISLSIIADLIWRTWRGLAGICVPLNNAPFQNPS